MRRPERQEHAPRAVEPAGPNRRAMLAVGVAGGSVAALAACSAAPAPTDVRAARGSDSSGSTTAGATSTGTTAGGVGTVLAHLSAIGVGTAVAAKGADGADILIQRTAADSVVAFSAVCPHQGCTVAANFVCPCHGSTFDPATGNRLSGPAPTGLAPVSVTIQGDEIVGS